MGLLIFKVTPELKAIMEHTMNADEWRGTYGVELDQSVVLVHDEGVYLMSAGTPGLMKNPDDKESTRHLVVHAEGCNPEDEDHWDTSRRLVGGDDFAELLPADGFNRMIAEGHEVIGLEVLPDSITIMEVTTHANAN